MRSMNESRKSPKKIRSTEKRPREMKIRNKGKNIN